MFKRRKQKKTNYKKRLALLKTRKPRLVVRKSLNHIRGQVIKFDKKGDKTIVSATSQELKKYNWKKHCGNSESAYLTGLLLAKKNKGKRTGKCVVDIGLQNIGNRILSFLKGAEEGGLKFSFGKKFPEVGSTIEGDKKIKNKLSG